MKIKPEDKSSSGFLFDRVSTNRVDDKRRYGSGIVVRGPFTTHYTQAPWFSNGWG
jgi:hypothetical protein